MSSPSHEIKIIKGRSLFPYPNNLEREPGIARSIEFTRLTDWGVCKHKTWIVNSSGDERITMIYVFNDQINTVMEMTIEHYDGEKYFKGQIPEVYDTGYIKISDGIYRKIKFRMSAVKRTDKAYEIQPMIPFFARLRNPEFKKWSAVLNSQLESAPIIKVDNIKGSR